MVNLKHKLLIEQIDKKLNKFNNIADIEVPSEGWIFTIRSALKMSLNQLGKRLKMTQQGVKMIEGREKEGSLTIKGLVEVGHALNMKFVYGFIPLDGSISKMIEKRAYEKAKEIVMRTSRSMSLEDQKVDNERLKKAIKDRADELIYKQPRHLWD